MLVSSQERDTDSNIAKHFAAIVASNFGLAMLEAFGAGEDRMVLLDATGGTNKYGYQLYSLVVVDDFREGVPAAFMLTSSQEAAEVELFMKVLLSLASGVRVFIVLKTSCFAHGACVPT